jgi:hypothetical protein
VIIQRYKKNEINLRNRLVTYIFVTDRLLIPVFYI